VCKKGRYCVRRNDDVTNVNVIGNSTYIL